MTLTANQFPIFYQAVNGYPPFPWQARLVTEIDAAGGRWPAVLDLPTSAGKTSALDAAVFLLAMQAEQSVHKRTAAIRTFFVVDRRIVVDEAAEKARKLAKLLNAADGKPDSVKRLQALARKQRRMELEQPDPLSLSDIQIIKDVATQLLRYKGDKALHVSVLRGGMYRDGSWAESPTQPTICLSTVDQVGSRLLFRGYGVSPYQRAVHAGLVGNDALILVDEAHLSRPFIETLKAVEFYRSERWAERPVKTPFQVVVMSATAGRAAHAIGAELEAEEEKRPPSIELDKKTDKNPKVCPELHRRLTAKKPAKLVESTDAGFVENLVDRALELAESEKGFKPVQVVGVVVNRVKTARDVADLLRRKFREKNSLPLEECALDVIDVVLLTGRVRPYDRDELLFRRPFRNTLDAEKPIPGLLPFVKATPNEGRTDYGRPPPPRGTLFVVATQTVEVGADFSFDALVTELAPLDALRQRFGRVDRLGYRRRSRAVIVRNKEADKDDRVYGTAPTALWKILKEWEKASGRAKEIDFGIQAIDDRLPSDTDKRIKFLSPLCAPLSHAPVMMPAHVDDWVQTSVAPVPDPDPALFLHGQSSGPADVRVVWRADVTEELLKDPSTASKVVGLVPPTSMEALSLPIWHVRSWLRDLNGAVADFTDLEGEPEPSPDRHQDNRPSHAFLIWKGPDRKKGHDWKKATRVSYDPETIRPGNTIIVPSSYGGCDEFGWNPQYGEPATDVADDCSWRAKRRPVLRFNAAGTHRMVLLGNENQAAIWVKLLDESLRRDISHALDELLGDSESETPGWKQFGKLRDRLPEPFAWLIPGRTKPPVRYPGRDNRGWVIVGPPGKTHPADPNADDADEEGPADDEGNSFIGVDGDEGNSFIGADGFVYLDVHCRGVRDRADQFGRSLVLAESLCQTVSRAGLLHDPGKADPRFQVWLYGSEAEAAKHGFRLIAKSKTEGRNAAAIEAARKRAGWPKGGRHEAASVLLVRSDPKTFAGLCDPELCEYLIGTHHGRGRPLWPFTEDRGIVESPGTLAFALEKFSLSAELPSRPEDRLAPLHEGWVDLFWRLVRRYGYWGLAYLETLLVLADHRQSEAERNEGLESG